MGEPLVARKPRKIRPNERYQGYDSKFEHDLHRKVLYNWQNHGLKIPYSVRKEYNPDFVRVIDGVTILVEAKGRFWDSDEYSKYIWVRENLPTGFKIVFIFYNPKHPMPRAKQRKDGTKRTHAEWANELGFEWYTAETFPDEWRE
jgi:hypothetical protein